MRRKECMQRKKMPLPNFDNDCSTFNIVASFNDTAMIKDVKSIDVTVGGHLR